MEQANLLGNIIGSMLFAILSGYISSKIFKIAGDSECKGFCIGVFCMMSLLLIIGSNHNLLMIAIDALK